MKLNIDQSRSQGDPYVIKENNKYYLYATHNEGVQLYVSDNFNDFEFKGFCYKRENEKAYWAPAVVKYNDKFYMYVSTMGSNENDVHKQRIQVAVSDTPDGEFKFLNDLTEPFSIDPHVVVSNNELYMFYSINDYEAQRAGTLIVVDKMESPTKMVGNPKIVVRATLDEEIFMRNRFREGQHWHTLEGAFYFRKGNYHYLTYSGNCYQNENYYIGYAVAYGDEDDLTKLEFKKYPDDSAYYPLIRKNDVEEGTGHNSVLEDNGKFYIIYHGRDYDVNIDAEDIRTARICEIDVNNEKLTVIKR
jgi:beta-xylosidase